MALASSVNSGRVLTPGTAYNRAFFMGVTGLTLTVTLSKNGAAFGALGGSVAEVGSGWYKVALTTGDTDTPGDLAYHATDGGSNALNWSDQVAVLPVVLADGVAHGGQPSESTATLALKQFNVYNPAGDAVTFNAAGGGGAGLTVTAGSDATAALVQGGNGLGLVSTAGDALLLAPSGGNGLHVNDGGVLVENSAGDALALDAAGGHDLNLAGDGLLAGFTGFLRAGTAQGGSTTSITLDAGASGADDYYKGLVVAVTGGQGAGQAAAVTAYDGTTKAATLSNTLATAPASGSTFVLLPAGAPAGGGGGGTDVNVVAVNGTTFAGPNVPCVLADGVSHGGTPGSSTATLALKQLRLANSADVAVSVASTHAGSEGILVTAGSNAAGIRSVGSGNGAGVRCMGGATGTGLLVQGGATSGSGLRAESSGGLDPAAYFVCGGGGGAGLYCVGDTTGHDITLAGDGVLQGDLGGHILGALTDLAAVPGATATTTAAINWLYQLARNKRTQTATTETVYKDNGTTAAATSAKADDGTTFTRSKYS